MLYGRSNFFFFLLPLQEQLAETFERIRNKNLKLEADKCEFCQFQIAEMYKVVKIISHCENYQNLNRLLCLFNMTDPVQRRVSEMTT